MTKPYKSTLPYKTYVRHLVANLKQYFFLNDWKIILEYPEADEPGHEDSIACVYVDSQYLNVIMSIFPMAEDVFEKDVTEFAEYIVHEMCHVLHDPVYKFAKDAATNHTQPLLLFRLEQQTQRTARVIFQNLPKKLYQF